MTRYQQMISERFAKQRDLSIWLTIILPLYTVAYLMQWYNYLDYLQVRPSPTSREAVLISGPYPGPSVAPLLTSSIHTYLPTYLPTTTSSCRCTKFSPC